MHMNKELRQYMIWTVNEIFSTINDHERFCNFCLMIYLPDYEVLNTVSKFIADL